MTHQALTPKYLLELVDQGLFRSLVLTDPNPVNHPVRTALLHQAENRYKKVVQLHITSSDQHNVLELLDTALTADCVFVDALDRIAALDNTAFSIRSRLDAQRNKRVIIYASDRAYKLHFLNRAAPFYRFCHRLAFDQIVTDRG